jgi:hypothetical protein
MIINECSGLKAGDKDILVATDVAGRGQNHCHNYFMTLMQSQTFLCEYNLILLCVYIAPFLFRIL